MSDDLRIVCGGRWTQDGRWVVIGSMFQDSPEVILFDPGNGMKGAEDVEMAWMDLQDCLAWVRSQEQAQHPSSATT